MVGGKLSRVEIRRLGPNDGTALEAAVRAFRGFELVPLHAGAACCSGTVTVSAAELPNRQRFFPGTTAWRSSYGRGQVVEGVNGMLKGGFLNIQHKFFRVFGLTKMTLIPREEGGGEAGRCEEDEEETSRGDMAAATRIRCVGIPSVGIRPGPSARLIDAARTTHP